MKELHSSIIILSHDFKNVLYIGSACMENWNAEHPVVVTFLKIPLEIEKGARLCAIFKLKKGAQVGEKV